MSSQKHIIRTITFDTAIANEELVDRWRNTIGRINIDSVFARALKPYDLQNDWTCIDRLEIDLGEMSWENEEDWNYKIVAALEEQLSEKIRFNIAGYNSSDLIATAYSEELLNIAIVDDDNYRMQALVDYFKTGVCPWQLQKFEDVAEVLMELVVKNPALVEQQLRRLVQHSASAVERLIMVLDYQQLIRVIKLFAGEETVDDLISLYATIEKLAPLARRKVIKQKMFRELLTCSVAEAGDIKKLMEGLLTREFIEVIEAAQWEKIKNVIDEKNVHNAELVRVLMKTIDGIIDAMGDSETKGVRAEEGERKKSEKEEHKEKEKEKEKESENAETQTDVVFVHNSGLVLLNAALIKHYFEKLGWVRKNDFRNEIARKKAILWLHYLTHGNHKIREYELSLAKLLCGMVPSDIADVKLKLTKKQREEADEMIETVIDSWTALKKVSREGLRQSFLQREGRLTHDEAGWQLHVTSKAYDILIEQLPWSYNIVKFPWMIKPLFIQWSTRI